MLIALWFAAYAGHPSDRGRSCVEV